MDSKAGSFDVGDRPRVRVKWYDKADTPTPELKDPTTTTCRILRPDGTVVTPVPVKEAVGIYYVDILLEDPGTYVVRFTATGDLVAAEEGSLYVEPPQVPLA